MSKTQGKCDFSIHHAFFFWPRLIWSCFECSVCVLQEELLASSEKTQETEEMLTGAEEKLNTIKNNMLQNDGMQWMKLRHDPIYVYKYDCNRSDIVSVTWWCFLTGQLDEQHVMDIIREKLNSMPCRNQGFVLDGYPKTYTQAKELFHGQLSSF